MEASCDICSRDTGYLIKKGGLYFHSRCWGKLHPHEEFDSAIDKNWNEAAKASRMAILQKYGSGKLITSITVREK